MPAFLAQAKPLIHGLRRVVSLPALDWIKSVPRILARAGFIVISLWVSTADEKSTLLTLGRNEWFLPLLGMLSVSGIDRLVRGSQIGRMLSQRRFLASATAASLIELRKRVMACDDQRSVDRIQAGILSTLVDKAREILGEKRDDVISANLMIADESNRSLTLTEFARTRTGREKISIGFDSVGAGQAITTMKPVCIEDIRSNEMQGAGFREDAPYRAILSIPISCEHRKLGVVNIDSTIPSHLSMEGLEDHLDPYVQLIGLTICYPDRSGGSNHA